MIEVKADGLEASFEALERDEDGVEALKAGAGAAQEAGRRGGDCGAAAGAGRGQVGRGRRASSSSICARASRAGWSRRRSAARPTRSAAMRCRARSTRRSTRRWSPISPIRSIANVVKVGSAGYRKLITTGGTPSGWVAYRGGAADDQHADVQRDRAGGGRALRQSGGVAADARRCDVRRRGWLANEIATEFARAEGLAFVKGTGTNQPLGFLSSPNAATADGVRPQGTLQFIGTGVSAGFRQPTRRTRSSTWSSRCGRPTGRARCS